LVAIVDETIVLLRLVEVAVEAEREALGERAAQAEV
jgi:hypothetical protein